MTRRNRLTDATSPYLRQHADNPVDWYPWGEEALARAREEDRPILLSVGYAACHWCHVMAHESFEDPDTAELMNRLFVNVKVDREERPDLDRIYQTAHQLMTRRPGGWPLTMFLTPDEHTPFFGGTYFPREARYGMPSFREVLARVAEYYTEHRSEAHRQGAALREVFPRLEPEPAAPGTALHAGPLAAAREQLGETFDARWGGFGEAPKFPHPTGVERLLRHWRATAHGDEPDVQALYMASLSLQRMAQGGIFDHVGGGFCRYSVDAWWMIPHFEKMLYDNAQLLRLYADVWRATGDEIFRDTAARTAAWLLADMQSPEGGFYSSRDADSEGEEGRYYVWTRDEIRALLTDEEYAVFAPHFGLDREPNFEGRWHLHVHADLRELASERGIAASHAQKLVDTALHKLAAARRGRVAPARDEKILTGWNGLTIRGLAVAANALGDARLADAAGRAAGFLRAHLRRDGRLLASYRDGRAHLTAYLDDYAFLADGLLALLETRWDGAHLAFAIELADAMCAHFEDREHGGFYFTADDHERLMHRPKVFTDDATPAGNAVAARVLGRLGHLLGEPRYLAAAERTLAAGWNGLVEFPHAHCELAQALEEHLSPVETVIVRGADEDAERLRDVAAMVYSPRRLVFLIPPDAPDLHPAIATKAAGETAVAYVCRGTTCSTPITGLEALAAELAEAS